MAKHSGIKDGGEYFVISPTSRKITVPHAHKSIGAVGDHLSEQITFECPQMVDGHDVSRCSHRYITWNNVNGEVGHDELKLTQVEQSEEGMIYLAWSIRNALTVAKGVVQFSIHFEDQDENGITVYRWSTATCKECSILESINGLLGTYKAIHVSGEKLVIEDYALVNENTLFLDSQIIPKDTLYITKNDTYDCYKYAKVDVKVNPPSGTLIITENNKMYPVEEYADVWVEVLPPQEDAIDISLVSIQNKTQYKADLFYTTKVEKTLQFVESRVEVGQYANDREMVVGTVVVVKFPTETGVLYNTKMGNVVPLTCGLGRFVFRVGLGEETITFE